MKLTPEQLLRRLTAKVEAVDGCWEWRGERMPNGYGRISVDGKRALVHRFAYTLLVGPIPEGHQLDHLCRNTICCNPAHLEPVTPRENTLRSTNHVARQIAATHCPHGHPYDERNTLRTRCGKRQCRTCSAARHRRWYAAKRQALGAA